MKGFKTYFTFLRRNKMFAAINVAGLAVSFMFILLIADMVTRQLTVDSDVPDADRIFVFSADSNAWGHYQLGLKFQDRYPEIEDWCAYGGLNELLCKQADDNELIMTVSFVKKNYFEFFGQKLIEGRASDALVSDNNVVLTRSAAYSLFGNESAIGKNVNISSMPFVVNGVVEDTDNSIFPNNIQVFIPIDNIKYFNSSADIDDVHMGNAGSAMVFFKYVKGFDPSSRVEDMENYVKEFFWIYQYGNAHGVRMTPMHDFYFSEIRTWHGIMQYDFTKVVIFLIAGIIILLMAVGNNVSMSVAQTVYRAKEMATRRLLGTSRSSVFWRMIEESLLMTVVAFIVGLLLAKAAEPYATNLLNVELDIIGDITWVTVLSWVAFVLLLSLVAGFIPASMLSGYNPLEVVKGGFRRKTKMVYLRILNVMQSGLTIALLACSIYLGIQIYSVLNAPLGYEYGNVLVCPTNNTRSNLTTFRTEVSKLPFVKNVSFAQGTPNDGGNNMTTRIQSGDSAVTFSFQIFRADSAFIKIFNIQITEDRKLANSWNSVYVSEDAYKDLEKLEGNKEKLPFNNTIAGQFKDFKIRSILQKDKHPLLMQVLPTDSIWPWRVLVEVADGDLGYYKQQIDTLISQIYDLPMLDSQWYGDMVNDTYRSIINMNKVMIIFTCVALLVSLLGLTAMNIYMISQRKRDIAVRKVFGSTARIEIASLMRYSLNSILISLVIAIPLSIIGITKIYDFVPYGDMSVWWIPIAAFVMVVVVSLASVYLIGYKAVNENPVENIKTE